MPGVIVVAGRRRHHSHRGFQDEERGDARSSGIRSSSKRVLFCALRDQYNKTTLSGLPFYLTPARPNPQLPTPHT